MSLSDNVHSACVPNENSDRPAHACILRWPHTEALHSWLFKMRQVKILIRQRECAG